MSDVDESIWEEWDECVATVIADCDKEENDSQRHGEGLLAKDGGPGWKCIEVLQRDFGHSSFRPLQWQIIKSILVDQRDNCVIMATGYGKSLTFQFPAVFKKGLSVVISPLISLMQDQVLALKMANINACYLGSAQTHKDLVMNDLLAGKIRVLYITPEYCTTTSLLQDLSSKLSITLVAIDEAHCVSQWGHDFRNSYRKLGQFRQALPNVPFLAVTATATPAVKRDICKSLCLKNPNLVCSSLDRPNLYLSASLKSNDMFSDFRKFMVKSENEKYWKFEGPTIIYCPTKKQTEEVYSTLRDRVLGCDFYHASRSLKDRTTVHENFLVDKLSVVIATVAYGMGIDKPDVRHVFHWGAPKEIESYYQEIGRAGRDGLPSKCHVFYCSRDFQLSQYFNAQGSGDIQEHRKDMCRLLERYLESKDCRRQNLLMHFEGKSSLLQKNKLQENCCDNCTTALKNGADFKEELFDFTLDAELLLKTIEALNRKGLNKVVSCIRGSKTSVISNRDLNAELHGKGKGKHENWWKALNRLLIREGYVEQQFLQFGKNEAGKGFPFPVLTLSRKGECFLSDLKENRSETSLLLPPCKEINRLVTQTRKPVPETVILSSDLPSTIVGSTTQNSLYHYLLRIRKERSAEIQCAPFHLASNQALIDLSNLRPSSVDLLRSARVDGFTDLKLQRDGLFWVTHIVDFCKENGLSIDNPQPTSTNDSAIHSLPPSAKETYEKFQRQQMEMEQIASERKVSKSTLVNHLCQALKVGLPLDFHRAGVPDFAQEKIISVISKPPINNVISKVKPIKEQCPDYINYDQIHLVVSYLIGLETIKKVTVCENVSTMDKFDIDSPSTSSAQLKGFTSSLKEHKSQTTLPTVWESKSSFSQAHNSKEKISKSHWKLQYDLCADDEESGQDPHDATNEEQCDYPQVLHRVVPKMAAPGVRRSARIAGISGMLPAGKPLRPDSPPGEAGPPNSSSPLDAEEQPSATVATSSARASSKTPTRLKEPGVTFECPSCHKHLKSRGTLKVHLLTHSGERPFGCTLCDMRFLHGYHLTRHIRVTHLDWRQDQSRSHHQCVVCLKICSESAALKRHLVTHTGDKPFQCVACPAKFTRATSLTRHVTCVHARERKHRCSLCPQTFSRSDVLKLHMEVHLGILKYACSYCPKKFALKCNLITHERVHTGEEPFACSLCPRRFKQAGSLLLHLPTHLPEKPMFACSFCPKKFAQKNRLRSHVRSSHTREDRAQVLS